MRPGNRIGVVAAPPGKSATITSPSGRPTARVWPSGLQAAAGTVLAPPGNGSDRSPSRAQSVWLASLVLPLMAVFAIKWCPPGWKTIPSGHDPSATRAWSGTNARRPQVRARMALARWRSGSARPAGRRWQTTEPPAPARPGRRLGPRWWCTCPRGWFPPRGVPPPRQRPVARPDRAP